MTVRTRVCYAVHMAETVRIEPGAYEQLAEVARAKHLTITAALTEAVKAYRTEMLMKQMSEYYLALQADPVAWAEELAERALWDRTNLDGLGDL